jgi:hypothetical protein
MGGPDEVVNMTNLTSTDFQEVWYVADPETSLTNWDGLVNGEEAFRIDSQINDPGGINHPLMYESMVYDGVFQAGETWEFIIQDYFNALGLAASLLDSCAGGPPCTSGLVGSLSAGGPPSSGSIIALIPEPSTALLFGLGLTALALRRRLSA